VYDFEKFSNLDTHNNVQKFNYNLQSLYPKRIFS
jgi:hypothetical protein